MCGIAGKYNLDGKPVSPELIESMCSTIVYRGPDDSGVYTNGCVGLGHRRLSILDLSSAGHQPMHSRDKQLWITYNGEIYNFKILREELISRGYSFSSNCDTEVILSMYEEYGEDCLKYLRGMFAFAIWDKRKDILFMARDRIGKKPLFYFYNGKTVVFASEIKAILEDPVVKKEIRYEALYDYFKFLYVPAPKTIFRNIFKIEPAHYILCSKSGITKKEYWDISFSRQSQKSEDEICTELLDILDESVRLRMISDVPLGAFLSGGVDSSAVVALMAKQQKRPVTTCSIGFDSEAYDEVAYARTVAELFGTDHYEHTVKQDIEALLPKLAYHFDEPFADSSSVPTYYVSKIARQKVTVALSGDGGDENFAGYEKYYVDDIENRIRRNIPRCIRKSIFPQMAGLLDKGNSVIFRKGRTLLTSLSHEPDYGFFLTNTEFDDALWEEMVNEDTRKRIGDYDPFSVVEYYYNRADTDDHLSKILYTDLKTYLPEDILVKVDRMSMANSLEVRAPILDHNVIEFAASVPPHLKYNNTEKKHILKQTFKGILPHEVMYRKKMGFSVPLAQWMRKEIREFTYNHLFSSDAGVNHFFRKNVIRRVWDLHQSETRDYSTILWSLLMFELWYKAYLK